MKIVFAVQILIILSFLFALRMQIWKTSLNSFIFISGVFLLTISREIYFFRSIWLEYHTSVVGTIVVIIMSRVAYQSFYKKYKEMTCNDCTNYRRRSTDAKEVEK